MYLITHHSTGALVDTEDLLHELQASPIVLGSM